MLRVLLVALLFCGCARSDRPGASTQSLQPPDLQTANSATPGQTIDLEKVLVSGKSTVLEFYSDACPPCREMAPVVERIAKAHPEIAFRKLNIDRAGMQEIDFDSPLATQMALHSVPSFRIYDEQGKLKADGQQAKDQMRTWFSQAQMFERAQNSAEGRELMKDYEEKTPRP